MRGHAKAGILWQAGQRAACRLPQRAEPVGIIAKAQLPRRKCPPVATALLIEHRQQGQPQPGFRRRCGDPRRHFGSVGIGRPTLRMVQIMELGHGGIPCLGHFHLHEGGNGLHVIRHQPVQKAVHQLPPGPEAVLPRAAPFRHSGHCALEGVGMQVDRGGKQAPQRSGGRPPGCDAGDPPAVNRHFNILRPAISQQGGFGIQDGHGNLA